MEVHRWIDGAHTNQNKADDKCAKIRRPKQAAAKNKIALLVSNNMNGNDRRLDD